MRATEFACVFVIWHEVSCFMYPYIVYKIVNIYVLKNEYNEKPLAAQQWI